MLNMTNMIDVITYRQWLHTENIGNYVKLQDLSSSCSDFAEALSDNAEKLSPHHFIAKKQAEYLRQLKVHLPPKTEAMVLLDFAENSFICQDAIQAFHWVNKQAILHPFAVYYREDVNAKIKCLSFCVISDHMDHSNETVHTFISIVINYIRKIIPELNYLKYFSDSASGQYKNCKNFMNLCLHENDFGIKGEWNFFATSHGKSPCDGIGGTVKRLVARASLQAAETQQILTPIEMFKWANQNIKGITFFYVSADDVLEHAAQFKERMMICKTVPGTRMHHRFVPVSQSELIMYRLSEDSTGTKVAVSISTLKYGFSACDVFVGQYIALIYDDNWYVGIVAKHDLENGDVLVNCMSRNISNVLQWPALNDECYVPYPHILCSLPAPEIASTSGRQYRLDHETINKIQELFEIYKANCH